MTALTLYEAAKSKSPVTAAFIEVFADNTPLSNFIRFQNKPSGVLKYAKEETLPGVAFRGVNESYTPSTGIVNPQVEFTKAFGGIIEVDRKIKNEDGDIAVQRQQTMALKNMAIQYSVAFMKGNSEASQNRQFDGLQRRITGRQLVENGANPLSLANLDDAISLVSGPTVIFCSRAMKNRLTASMRDQSVAGNINMQPVGDLRGFGQEVVAYNGTPIVDYGEDELGNDILAFDETVAGGGSDNTSIYVVSFEMNQVEGFQSNPPEVVDDVETGKATTDGTLFEWFTGLAVLGPKAAARISGIKDAAVTA